MAKMSPEEYLKLVQEQQKALDPITLGSSTISGIGNMWDSIAEQRDIQNAGREDLADSVVGNSWTDIFNNRDRLAQGIQTVDNNRIDVSGVNDINTLANIGVANNLQDTVTAGTSDGSDMYADAGEGAKIGASLGSIIPGVGTAIGAGIGLGLGAVSGFARSAIGDINNKKNARILNERIKQANKQQINDIYDRADIINQKQLRQNMMNYFAEGGSLEELNGVTKIGAGSTHEQNPNNGVQMGIAPDNLPNLVEEGEVVYKDYVYSNRLKPSKSLLKQHNLPEKYAGKTFAELAEILQKESEDRPNDPVSLRTLEDWMSRLTSAQEEHKAKQEERRLAKAVNNMSDEEKAVLMSSLEQPMAQQEEIDLSQPMYAKGGKIYIKPENRGKFTALKKRTGKSASWFKAHGTPAQKKMATFALNAKKWSHKHDLGDYLFLRDNNRSTPWYDFNAEIRDNPLFPYLMSEGNTQVSPIDNNSNINIRYDLTHAYDTPNMASPIWRQDLFTNNLPESTPVDYVTKPPYRPYSEQTELKETPNDTPKGTVNTDLLARRLGESLRYAPAIGAQLGAITAALQPKDYTLANRLEDLASEFRPMSAPHIGGYRRYTPYDVNLGDVENIGLTAAALNANRGQNRATQGTLNTAVLAKAQETSAKRNLTTQQANEANRLATDTYNLGIDQFNAQRDSAYDQLNQQILANRINMLGQAAQVRDASRTAWASNINTTAENAFNQLGNVGRDNWNRNQRDFLLKALGREGLLELIKLGYFKS